MLKTVSGIATMKYELLQEISRTTVKPRSRAANSKTTSVTKQRKSSKELSTTKKLNMSSHQMNSNLRPYLGTETCPVVCCYSWQGWKWIANCNNLAILCQQKIIPKLSPFLFPDDI